MTTSNQAGVFGGLNPTVYNPSNPLPLFIIQLVIIVVICRLLHYPLSLLRQPRVIAEVIGGVLLGPSVMGHIPNFNSTIFPPASMPMITLVANFGLVFFLFLVGLEVDISLVLNNLRTAGSVALAGMALPFGLGVAVSYGLYHTYHVAENMIDPVSFGLYALFIGVAMAITAFPVLARILTELKLLSTNVGTVVLSAGVSNDIVGWVLLALTVALVNASSGIVALWVVLVSCGWILFLLFIVKPIFRYVARRSGSLDTGPTQFMMILTFIVVLVSAFFTSIIGVHPIFGGFLAGIVVPHDRVFAVGVTEKIEDIISLLFLPLYFALSGLQTNLGLLDNGTTWAYTIAIIVIAMATKVTGGTLAAKVNGLLWRESLTVGTLMSCKGLVELIVLNVGLQAGILSQRVFTMFVVMALVCTFLTTPLTTLLYPPWYQKKVALWRRGDINWNDPFVDVPNVPHRADTRRPSSETVREDAAPRAPLKVLVMLTRLESIAGITVFLRLLMPNTRYTSSEQAQAIHPSRRSDSEKVDSMSIAHQSDAVMIHGLKLEELTDRTSALMRATSIEDEDSPLSLRKDPILQSFVSVGKFWDRSRITGAKAIIPDHEFAEYTASKAADLNSDMVVVPWTVTNAADNDFLTSKMVRIVKGLYESVTCDIVVALDRGFEDAAVEHVNEGNNAANWMFARGGRGERHHILFPFFGTKDDLEALKFLKERVFGNKDVTATIVHGSIDTDSHDRLLSFSSAYSERIVLESIDSDVTDVSQYLLAKAKQEIRSSSDFIVLGHEPIGGAWTQSSSSSSLPVVVESTPLNVLGDLADRLVAGGVLGSIIVYRAK
ncbi:Sodium/hydrogen exchanger family-domain-containing protein [Lipomyces chichibuensis]|uniref:Sodium/hydrogen exchanger family-domain-containing protein n=1 Tax=Lipomyces chichibuensis TaxID=1546026 RepID=UPI00334358A5